MTDEKLKELIYDKVYTLYLKNNDKYSEDLHISQLTAQLAVYATLQVLEELGVLSLPTKSEEWDCHIWQSFYLAL